MKKLVFSFAIPLLAACSSVPETSGITSSISSRLSGAADVLDITSHLRPYRIDVRQGNLVTQDMVAQLKPGLTKDQVRFILGTPLLTDVFHADRWDYVYRLQKGDGDIQQRRFIVFFAGGKLARVGGDVGGLADVAAEAAAPKPAARMIEIKGPETAAAPADKDAQPEAAAVSQ